MNRHGVIWSTIRRIERKSYANRRGYLRVSLKADADNKQHGVCLARLVAETWLETPIRSLVTKMVVHHRNGDRGDCSAANLIWVSQSESLHMAQRKRGETSLYRNVRRFAPKSWIARVCVHGKAKHIGCFATEKEAALAVDAHTVMIYGDNAKRNISPAAA